MRRLSLIRSAAHARGGWIVFEYLREFGFLGTFLAVAVGVLHRLTPEPDAVAVAAQGPVYGLGLTDDGRTLWVNRHRGGLVLVDLESETELTSICDRDSLTQKALAQICRGLSCRACRGPACPR